MLPRVVPFVVLVLVTAMLPPLVAQTLPEFPLEEQPYAIVQETDEHYVLVIDLPAAVFDPTMDTAFDVPLGLVHATGGSDEEAYKLRILLAPETVDGEGAYLADVVYAIDAELRGELNKTPVPVIGELPGASVPPTIEELAEAIRQAMEDLDDLRAATNATREAIPESPDELGGLPVDPAELRTLRSGLERVDRQYTIVYSFLDGSLTWLTNGTDIVTEGLPGAENGMRLARAAMNDTRAHLEELNETVDPSGKVGTLEETVGNVTEEAGDLEELINGTYDGLKDQVRSVRGTVRETVRNGTGDAKDHVDVARELVREVRGNLTGDDEPGDPDPDPEPEPLPYPDLPWETLHDQLHGLIAAADQGLTPETSEEMHRTLDQTFAYLERDRERLNATLEWLETSPAHPLIEAEKAEAESLIADAEADLATIAEALGVGGGANETDENETEPLPKTLRRQVRELGNASADLRAAARELANASRELDPFATVETFVDNRIERATQVRVLIPKDLTRLPLEIDPTTGLPTPPDPTNTTLPDPGLPTGTPSIPLELPGGGETDEDDASGPDQDPGQTPAQVSPPVVTVSPGSLSLDEGEQAVVSITVRNEGPGSDTYQLTAHRTGPIAVDAIAPSSLTLGPGEQDVLQVRVSPTDDGEGNLRLVLTSDRGTSVQRDVPVSIAQAPASAAALEVDVTPYTVRLASEEEGSVAVSVRNNGAASDTVSLAPRAEGPLTAEPQGPASITLAPGEEGVLQVRLVPRSTGSGSVSLKVTSANGGAISPVLLVDIHEPTVAATHAGDAAAAPAGEDETPSDDEEEDRGFLGIPGPGLGVLLALSMAALVASALRREH